MVKKGATNWFHWIRFRGRRPQICFAGAVERVGAATRQKAETDRAEVWADDRVGIPAGKWK